MRLAGPQCCAGLVFASLAIGLVAAIAAEPKAKQPLSPWAALVQEIVPDDAPARPPFQIGRYDLGIRWRERSEPSATAMTRHAATRQERLQRLWNEVRNEAPALCNLEQRAEERLLSYALGESALDEALQAAHKAGPTAEFRLARLLLAECRFDEAVTLLATIAEQPGGPAAKDLSRQALTLLARHDAERSALAIHLPLVPLAFDLSRFLKRQGSDPARQSLIEAARQTVVVRLPEVLRPENVDIGEIEESPPAELDVDPTLSLTFEPPRSISQAATDNPWGQAILHDAQRPYLATGGPEFVLDHESNQPLDNRHARFALHSEFNGPLCFRLYRFTARAAWEQATAASLGTLKPERTWRGEYQPLEQNNHGAKQWPVELADLADGYYLLTVEARYSSLLAGCKFILSNVALYLRAGPNQTVTVAVDRHSGRPVAGMNLRLRVHGQPDESSLVAHMRPSDEKAFLQGFHGERGTVLYESGLEVTDKKPASHSNHRDQADDDPFGDEPELKAAEASNPPDPFGDAPAAGAFKPADEVLLSPAQAMAAAESYTQGVEARRRWPDEQKELSLRTGDDGRAAVDLDLSRSDYRYELDVQRTDDADVGLPSHVSLSYRQTKRERNLSRVVLWLAQPVHRPGEMAEFTGLVRKFDGKHMADYSTSPTATARKVEVAVRGHDGEIWHGPCEVSAAGTFHNRFRIPPHAGSGPCRFSVDDTSTLPQVPLVIDEFRLSTFNVQLTLPQRSCVAGQRVEGEVGVTYFTGKAAAGTEVEVVAETGDPAPPSIVGTTGVDGVFRFRLPIPESESSGNIVLRTTVTDVSGQSYTATNWVLAHAAAFRVRTVATPQSVAVGAVVPLEVYATHWDDRPVMGATVTVVGSRLVAVTDRDGRARLLWKVDKHRDSVDVTVVAGGKAVHDEMHAFDLRESNRSKKKSPGDTRLERACANRRR